jgi:iron complex transport system substrate-binding protein
MSHYQRIACLCTEAVETLYALGAQEHIAGISGFTVRPPQARREKPKISGFSSAKLERILAVKPDLVIGFSNLQADICRDLAAAGIEVLLFNQRDVGGILRMVRVLGALVQREAQGEALVRELQACVDQAREQAAALAHRPRVYFEEWDDPLISGIGWVSELIGIAGGDDVFADLACHPGARERIIADPQRVVAAAPDLILASWCGKKFRAESLCARPGWEAIPAVRNAARGMVAEIKSADILSPGPAALQHGLPQIAGLASQWNALRAKGELA